MYYSNFKVKVNNITWIIPKRKRGPVCLFWGLFILIPLCIRLIRDPRLSTSNGRQRVYLDVYRQMMYDPYRFYTACNRGPLCNLTSQFVFTGVFTPGTRIGTSVLPLNVFTNHLYAFYESRILCFLLVTSRWNISIDFS